MRIWVLALLLAVFGPANAFAKDAKIVKLRDAKPAAKAPLKAKPAPKKHAAKRVVKKPVRKKSVAKPKAKPKAKHHDDDAGSAKKKPDVRPMP
jgi:hypothetical protein